MSFRANALAMLTGTVMAQALPLLASPLLTRLYTPEAFGLQTLFMGLAATLAVLATCRMDLAVVLPDDEGEARSITGLILLTTAIVTVLSAFVVPAASAVRGAALAWQWTFLLPAMVLCVALFQLGVGLASRNRAFRPVAKASVANQATYVAGAVAMGITGAWVHGLAAAKAAGQAVAAGGLLWGSARPALVPAVRSFRWSAATAAARKYRQFIIFNTPYSLVGSVARDAPVYTFTLLAAVGAAGWFGLARTMLLAPTLLAANAFSQVFYREAVALKGTPQLQQLTLTLLRFGLLALAPLFAFCAVWGDALFAVVFGEGWRQAGTFAMLLAPAAWMSVQTGWPERLFEVHMRQDVSFAIQLGSDAVTALAFAGTYLATREAATAVAVFALCNVLYHFGYLAAIFRVSGFAQRALAGALARGWLLFGLAAAAFAGLRIFGGQGIVIALAAMLLAAGAAAGIGWRLGRGDLRAALAGGTG